jgi:citrate synthase
LLENYAIEKKDIIIRNDTISDSLFQEYGVNRGLRDVNGKGVLTGLTNISNIVSFEEDEKGNRTPCDGQLWYRGYNVRTLIGRIPENGFGFEEVAYLLLFGELPSREELTEFGEVLGASRTLPTNFTRDVIMKAPTKDIMNSMTRSILTLAAYDKQTADGSIENNIRQCIQLIANFPMLAVYGYHAYNHYENNSSMYIHRPDTKLSTAENFLRMLRPDNQYTQLEAEVLDVALILHMEHGGGNNSTFTTRVVTSAGTDTYSAIAAAMSSLKGPKHGGANIKVMEMMNDIRKNVRDWGDRDEVKCYLSRMLDGEVFDGKGLIYGMGHAVYSLSDPRERVFRSYVEHLAAAKHREKDMNLYNMIEELAPELIAEKRHIFKGVSPNVDFYSGFVYEMLGIPMELYTPLFAIARICGWSAHRIEELVGMNKIIRPAYKSVMKERE